MSKTLLWRVRFGSNPAIRNCAKVFRFGLESRHLIRACPATFQVCILCPLSTHLIQRLLALPYQPHDRPPCAELRRRRAAVRHGVAIAARCAGALGAAVEAAALAPADRVVAAEATVTRARAAA